MSLYRSGFITLISGALIFILLTPQPAMADSQSGGLPVLAEEHQALVIIVEGLVTDLATSQGNLAATQASLASTQSELATAQAILADSQRRIVVLEADTDELLETSHAVGDVAFGTLSLLFQNGGRELATIGKHFDDTAVVPIEVVNASLTTMDQMLAKIEEGENNEFLLEIGLNGDWIALKEEIIPLKLMLEEASDPGSTLPPMRMEFLISELLNIAEAFETVADFIQGTLAELVLQNYTAEMNQVVATLSAMMKSNNETTKVIIDNLK